MQYEEVDQKESVCFNDTSENDVSTTYIRKKSATTRKFWSTNGFREIICTSTNEPNTKNHCCCPALTAKKALTKPDFAKQAELFISHTDKKQNSKMMFILAPLDDVFSQLICKKNLQ
uniref:Uncharacterized protein n=1 Tax=Romanomermis culicivorax TaxID=13658 RepID=A0A915IIM6_ROMCU